MQYILRVNATGVESTHDFKPGDFDSIVRVENGAPTHEQAYLRVSIWNRSQEAHRQDPVRGAVAESKTEKPKAAGLAALFAPQA